MIVILLVLALVVLLALVNPPRSYRRYPAGPPPGWEPPEEREARLRLEALIASYPARHRAFMEARRPTALAEDIAERRVLLEWPDGRREWMSLIELHAKRLQPKGIHL